MDHITLEEYSSRILRPSILAEVRSGALDETLARMMADRDERGLLAHICEQDPELADAVAERLCSSA